MDLLYKLLADLQFGNGLGLVASQTAFIADKVEYRHVRSLKEKSMKIKRFLPPPNKKGLVSKEADCMESIVCVGWCLAVMYCTSQGSLCRAPSTSDGVLYRRERQT